MKQTLTILTILAALTTQAKAQQQTIELDRASGVLGYSLGTGSTKLTGIPTTTYRITFVNPGASITIYVCPSVDLNGNALTPGSNPGNIPILAGDSVIVTGNGVFGTSWLATAASGSGNPFTVIPSPNP